jgi:hypothetical protein
MLSRYTFALLGPVVAGCILITSPVWASESVESSSADTEIRSELQAIGIRDKLARLPNADRAKGKPVPGQVRTDMYAKLQINPELRTFLDFFVDLADSAEDKPAVEDLMMTVLERRGMRGHIRVQVLEVMRDYMPYRMALKEQQPAPDDSAALTALREKYLGEEQARLLF